MFGKHYDSMYTGSMRGMGAVAFAVWGYVISHVSPPDYELEMNPDVIGFLIGEPTESVALAIEKFCSPDPRSRSEAEGGRKLLKKGEFLYYVVNGKRYHEIQNQAERRAYWREQKQRKKAAQDAAAAGGTPPADSPEVPPATPPPEKKNGYHEDAIDVLNLINELSGRKFRDIDSNIAEISARLSERGVDFEGCVKMLRRQWSLWKDSFSDGKPMREYLRPSTLFGKENFDKYYSARDLPIEKPKPTASEKYVPPNPYNETINVPRL